MVVEGTERAGGSGAGNPDAKAWEDMVSQERARGENVGSGSGESQGNEQLVREFTALMQKAAEMAAQISPALAAEVAKLAGNVPRKEEKARIVGEADDTEVSSSAEVVDVDESEDTDDAADARDTEIENASEGLRTVAEISAKLAEKDAEIERVKSEIRVLGGYGGAGSGEKEGGESRGDWSKGDRLSEKIVRDLRKYGYDAEINSDSGDLVIGVEEESWIPVGQAEQLENGGLLINYDVPIPGEPGKFRRETETIAPEDVQKHNEDFKKWMKKTINREIASIGGVKSFLMITSERPLDNQSLWKYQIWWKNLDDTQRENVIDLMEGVEEDDKANTGGSLPWTAIKDFLAKVKDGSWEVAEGNTRNTRDAAKNVTRETAGAAGRELRTVAEISAKLAEKDAEIEMIRSKIRVLERHSEAIDEKIEGMKGEGDTAGAEKKAGNNTDKYSAETASFGDKMRKWAEGQKDLSPAGQEFMQTLTGSDEDLAKLSSEDFEHKLKQWGELSSPEQRQILEAAIDSLEALRKESGGDKVAINIPTIMLARIYKNGRYSLRKPDLEERKRRSGEEFYQFNEEIRVDDVGKEKRIQDVKKIEAELEKHRAGLFEEEAKKEVERRFRGRDGSDRHMVVRRLSEDRPWMITKMEDYQKWWEKVPVWQKGEVRRFMRDLHKRDVEENKGKLSWKPAMTFFGFEEDEEPAA